MGVKRPRGPGSMGPCRFEKTVANRRAFPYAGEWCCGLRPATSTNCRRAPACRHDDGPLLGNRGMLRTIARGLQLLGLLVLPVAMGMQLQGMSLWRMLMLAGAGIGVFYVGYLLQAQARR